MYLHCTGINYGGLRQFSYVTREPANGARRYVLHTSTMRLSVNTRLTEGDASVGDNTGELYISSYSVSQLSSREHTTLTR